MPYLFNFILVIAYYFVITHIITGKNKAKKKFVTLVCVHAVLFRALANPYNYVDTEVYAEAFYQISSWNLTDVLNPLNFYAEWGQGYVILNWLLSKISAEPQFLFASLSVLSIVPVMWFYFKTSHSILFTIVIYLLYPMFIIWVLVFFDNIWAVWDWYYWPCIMLINSSIPFLWHCWH